MNLKQLDEFHQTRNGYIVFGLVELTLGYLFFSLAVNSGSLWQWALVCDPVHRISTECR